jgi:hypothetical protein
MGSGDPVSVRVGRLCHGGCLPWFSTAVAEVPVVERERRVAGYGQSAKQPVKPLVAHTR